MNTSHYISSFSTLSQTFIYDLIQGLESRKISHNFVLTRNRENEKERPFSNVLITKNKHPLTKLWGKLTDPSHLKIQDNKVILNHFKSFETNIVHSHFGISAIRMNNLLMKNNSKLPHVCSFHGNDILSNPFKIKGYHQDLLKINYYPKLVITVPSNFLKQKCIELGIKEEKIKVFYNTIHPRFFEPPKATPWDGKERLEIITVGRVVEMKGHEYALKALSLLKKDFNHFHYTIAGDGVLLNSLKELTHSLGLDNHVSFLGAVSHEQLPHLLKKSHLCLIPSIRAKNNEEDTFCLTLVEGAIKGLFCICSDTKGPVEVLGPNQSYVYSQKKPQELVKLLKKFLSLSSEQRRSISNDLTQYMIKNFHHDQYFLNYKNLYESLSC